MARYGIRYVLCDTARYGIRYVLCDMARYDIRYVLYDMRKSPLIIYEQIWQVMV